MCIFTVHSGLAKVGLVTLNFSARSARTLKEPPFLKFLDPPLVTQDHPTMLYIHLVRYQIIKRILREYTDNL